MRPRLAIGILLLFALTGCGPIREAEVVDRSSTPPAPRPHPPATPMREPSVPQHVVVAGDTLYSIAFRHGRDVRELAAWNRIPPPYTIYPGRRLALAAPATSRREPVHSQQRVETFAIRDSGASTSAPPSPSPPPVRTMPASPSASLPPSAPRHASPAVVSRPVAPASPVKPTSKPAEPIAIMVPPAPAVAPPAVPAPVAPIKPPPAIVIATGPARSVGGVTWRWPSGGRVAQRFVPGDAARQGIDIVGNAGQAVLAAADGEVVYSGNGLLGYGELIIVKHSADFLSAYGHNRTRLVAEGTRVKAGQQIAEMGQTGASLHQLHFEIRRSGKPVDPLTYLPSR